MPASPAPRAPTERFGDRAADYARHRPGYPDALIDHLRAGGWLRASARVADIGGGTGLSSRQFLDAGCRVDGVEPNAAMRALAERTLGHHPQFRSVNGCAEATTLADGGTDLIAAGTAFHWFEPVATRREFIRILRSGGAVALFWNRRADRTSFMQAYERVLFDHVPGYAEAAQARHADDAAVRTFFGHAAVDERTFPVSQSVGFEGLLGRVLSSSYAPRPETPAFVPLRSALQALFDEHAADGLVRLDYDTVLHVGCLG